MGFPKRLFFVALTTSLSASTFAQNAPVATVANPEPYCLALRGNGENEPAHWGALASLVERAGLPQAQAGGSSATYSMLLLESIASNAWVANSQGWPQASRAALLLKSISGISAYVAQRPQVQAALEMVKTYRDVKTFLATPSWPLLKEIAAANSPSDLSRRSTEIAQLVKDLMAIGIGDSKYAALMNDLGSFRMLSVRRFREMRFYAEDLSAALAAFGSFNAEDDKTLFFRAGFVNFEKFGLGVGRVATFLEGSAWTDPTKVLFRKFTDLCEPLHANLSWQELVAREPRCQQFLNDSLASFFSQNTNLHLLNVALRPVGFQIPTLATTAVLMGDGFSAAQTTMRDYHDNLDRTAIDRFKIKNPNDLRLGYWGRPDMLTQVRRNLRFPFRDALGRVYDFSGDAKSDRFLSLGPVPWSEVFRLSPAEPGLASLQLMTVAGTPAFSAGGWSDLHPVQVLKAAGCPQVAYVTRRGGESLFGQGLAKRLMSLDRDWSLLRTVDPDLLARNRKVNDAGDPSDLTSAWSRLYNLANPRSSFNTALVSADAILCTDWDRFDVKTQFYEMVIEAYRAPFVVNPWRRDFRAALISRGGRVVDGNPILNTSSQWAGCHAP